MDVSDRLSEKKEFFRCAFSSPAVQVSLAAASHDAWRPLGHDVVAADTFLSGHWQTLKDFEGDVLTLEHANDIDSILDVVDSGGQFDVIFHEAAITGVIAKDGSAQAGDDVQGFPTQ